MFYPISFTLSTVIWITFYINVQFSNQSALLISSTSEISELIELYPNITEFDFKSEHHNLTITSNIFTRNSFITSLNFCGFIVDVLPNAFVNLLNLKALKMHNCKIRYLHRKCFAGLYNLDVLDLSNNDLSVLSSKIFQVSSNIRLLNVSFNGISYFTEADFNILTKSVHQIDLRGNPLQCHCINKWMINSFRSNRLLIDDLLNSCDFHNILPCNNVDFFSFQQTSFHNEVKVQVFTDVELHCPINFDPKHRNVNNSIVKWISPQSEVFGFDDHLFKNNLNNVSFVIQPLFIQTRIWVNSSTLSLNIENFRGHFSGTWTCTVWSTFGQSYNFTIAVTPVVYLEKLFVLTVIIGFIVAGVWLFLAAIIALSRYLKETSCCTKKIDYDKSDLFEKRYVHTVIPVPIEESVSSEDSSCSSNDSESNCTKPLTNRMRYESHSNDVQLIFKDEQLAAEYAQMLSELKEASESGGDEKFKDRLSILRNRFSIDFRKMRFDFKRGMESLRSSSSSAAHKFRKGMGQMKDHMRSFTEFCGTSSIAQSISIVVIPADSQTSQTDSNSMSEPQRQEKKVFTFFEVL